MASYSTNPYNNFHAANSKEYISLDKGAKQDFRPETRFDIIPGNSDLFSAEIKKYSTQFGYGALLNVPSERDVDATDPNIITYKNHVNIIKTWNKITDDIIAKNANEIWGARDWTISVTKQLDKLTATRGDITGVALTRSGKKKFMQRWKSTILAHHVMALLTPEGQASIKIRENAYQWIDPITDEIVVDGCSLLNEALKLMRPDVQTNVYAELAKIKAIKPVDHGYNVVKWHSAMESKRIAIEQKVPGSYHESQFIMDYLDASLTIEAKSFKAEVNIIRNRYLRGNPDKWNATYICGEIIKTYNNMFEDGTWKREIAEKDQIIALSTKVAELQAKLETQDKRVVALATQATKGSSNDSSTNGNTGDNRRGKRAPYTVAAWRLTKSKDKVSKNGKDYFWCTGEHWSGGQKYNGMYADHKTCDHDSWRARMDERRKGPDGRAKETSKPVEAPSQKLTLNDKLRNAFCTQAGLSSEEVDRIWQDAQGNE